jgi:hypothetical protein
VTLRKSMTQNKFHIVPIENLFANFVGNTLRAITQELWSSSIVVEKCHKLRLVIDVVTVFDTPFLKQSEVWGWSIDDCPGNEVLGY